MVEHTIDTKPDITTDITALRATDNVTMQPSYDQLGVQYSPEIMKQLKEGKCCCKQSSRPN